MIIQDRNSKKKYIAYAIYWDSFHNEFAYSVIEDDLNVSGLAALGGKDVDLIDGSLQNYEILQSSHNNSVVVVHKAVLPINGLYSELTDFPEVDTNDKLRAKMRKMGLEPEPK